MRILKEPLLHFLFLGALLFAISALRDSETPSFSSEIIVTAGQVEHLAAGFARTWRSSPTEMELSSLIEEHVREEVYYREALNLGLDQGDSVIRQRLRQKVQFLLEGLIEDVVPSDSTLHAFMQSHQQDYSVPPRAAFRQLYFSPDRRGETIREQVLAVLAVLDGKSAAAGDASLADPFLMPMQVELSTVGQISRMFGADFSEQVMQLQPGRWDGPLASGYGLHLVYLDDKKPGRPLELDEVRPRLLADWRQLQRRELLDQTYERLRARYSVRIERPQPGASDSQAQPEDVP